MIAARRAGVGRATAMPRCGAAILALVAAIGLADPALAAGGDADWPCIQRKVPELSLGQIWTGVDLPKSTTAWKQDTSLVALVDELAARRIPVEEAERKVGAFAASLAGDTSSARMLALVRGLFDTMNTERSDVISGIARYARGQADIAERLRREASEVDALRMKPGADEGEIEERTDRLAFETRLYDERVQALTFVCEVPTLIEQRLYRLVNVIAALLPAK